MFIHKSGNQALVFRRLSKLTDALYPITFLDVLAFHGSYFKARILQAGRTLVGLLGTDVTAPPPPPSHLGLSPPSVPACYRIMRSSLSYSRGHLSTYFTLFSSCLLFPPCTLQALCSHHRYPRSSNPLWPPPSTFWVCCLRLLPPCVTCSPITSHLHTFPSMETHMQLSWCLHVSNLQFWVSKPLFPFHRVLTQACPYSGHELSPLKGCICNCSFW